MRHARARRTLKPPTFKRGKSLQFKMSRVPLGSDIVILSNRTIQIQDPLIPFPAWPPDTEDKINHLIARTWTYMQMQAVLAKMQEGPVEFAFRPPGLQPPTPNSTVCGRNQNSEILTYVGLSFTSNTAGV